MPVKSTMRESMLDWIVNGDPKDLPICMSWGAGVAAPYYGKDSAETSVEEQIKAAEETGIHHSIHVSGPMPHSAVPYVDGIEMHDVWDENPEGVRRLTSHLETPEGTLRAVTEYPKSTGSYHREFFVKGPEELPALSYFIRNCCEAFLTNPEIVKSVREEAESGVASLQGRLPSCCHVFCAAVELLSSYYMDQGTAVYLIYDYQDLFEELMDYHWKMTQTCLAQLVETGIDFYTYAINGYEWLSPDLYTRYMVPQAAKINEIVSAHGKLSWLHTCGKLKHIAEAGMYQQMGVDVVESLSSLPTGDIDDLAKTRAQVGPDIVTRGGINVEWFYSKDPEDVKRAAWRAIEGCAGYKHMLGDTNNSYPDYPWANIQALIDVVRETGRMYV